VKAGPGDYVGEDEELDRVVGAIEALVRRFDVPVSVDTWRASVARASYRVGAVMGNDISGFGDPDYLAVAAEAGAAVVATHIRLAPRVADPDPHYDDVVAEVAAFLAERAERALAAGVGADRIVVDAGLDLGKTAEQSLALLRASDTLSGLGYPLLLSASNKTFLGVLYDLAIGERREASLIAAALGPRWVVGSSGSTTWPGPAGWPRCSPPSRRPVSAAKADAPPAAAYLVKGDDASLVAQATRELLGQLVGERDAGLVVEEFGGSSGDDLDIGR